MAVEEVVDDHTRNDDVGDVLAMAGHLEPLVGEQASGHGVLMESSHLIDNNYRGYSIYI